MFGNTRQGGGGKDQFVRLTGLFQTKKGNWIGRVKPDQFNAIVALMKDAHQRNGTLNFIIAPDKSGKPAMSCVVGDEYVPNKPQQKQQSGGFDFGTPPQAAQQRQAPQQQREVQFGQADLPAKDDFDSLLESL